MSEQATMGRWRVAFVAVLCRFSALHPLLLVRLQQLLQCTALQVHHQASITALLLHMVRVECRPTYFVLTLLAAVVVHSFLLKAGME